MILDSVVNGIEKLALARELRTARKSVLGVATGRDKISIIRRIREIRVLLSVKVENGVEIAVDPGNKIATLQSLKDYLTNGIMAVPEPLRASESQTIEKALKLAQAGSGLASNDNLMIEAYAELRQFNSGTMATDAFDYFKTQGDAFTEGSADAYSLHREFINLREEPVVEVYTQEQNDELNRISNAISDIKALYYGYADEMKSLIGSVRGITDEQYETLTLAKRQADKDWNRLNEEFSAVSNAGLREKNRKLVELQESITVYGKQVIDNMTESSTITQEQAEAWVKDQVISKDVAKKLIKNGYPIEDVHRDMAEFYLITNGKLKDITLVSTASKRASAANIGTYEANSITVTKDFNKRCLWHEMAHHLENDDLAVNAANGFLLKRRFNEVPKSLRSLTGNKFYGKDEIAYEDGFINPYIGKVYRDKVTEVFSMGVEYLSSPESAAQLLAKDPEMLSLIAGYMQVKLSPATVALYKLQDSKLEVVQSENNSTEEIYNTYLDKLANEVDLIDDGWFGELDERHQQYLITGGYRVNDPNAKYLGSYHNQRVFSGKFKGSHGPRRTMKGFAVGKFASTADVGDGTSLYPIIEDLKTVKAMLKLADNENTNVSNVYNLLFAYPDKLRFIRSAKAALGEAQ